LAQAITAILTDRPARVVRAIRGFTTAPLKNITRLYSRRASDPLTVAVGQAQEIDQAQTVSPILGAGNAAIIIRPYKPHTPQQVPYSSRLFEILAPDFVRVGKTVVSAGVHPSRISAGFSEEVLEAKVKPARVSTKEGDTTIEARLKRNRIDAD